MLSAQITKAECVSLPAGGAHTTHGAHSYSPRGPQQPSVSALVLRCNLISLSRGTPDQLGFSLFVSNLLLRCLLIVYHCEQTS